jgi:hypothetical protein
MPVLDSIAQNSAPHAQRPSLRFSAPRYAVFVDNRPQAVGATFSLVNSPRGGATPSIASRSLHEVAAEEASEIVLESLRHAGLSPDRRSVTSDGSVLFEFLSFPVAGVDIYPNGEAIVVVRDGQVDSIQEFVVSDTERIVAVLKNGRR